MMKAIYTLSDGRRILVFWNKVAKVENATIRYHYINHNGDYRRPIISYIDKLQKDKKNNKIYFIVNQEKIYVDEFDYDTVDNLIEKLKVSKNCVDLKDCEILATFLKDTENVGIVAELVTKSWTVSEGYLTPLFTENPYSKPILCILTEKDYEKIDWDYSITLEAENKELRNYYANEKISFTDFCIRLRNGEFRLVNKTEYKKIYDTKRLEKKKGRF